MFVFEKAVNEPLRRAYYAAAVLVGFMLLGSVAWYRQRLLFVDAALYVFEVLNAHRFAMTNRYTAVLSQVWIFAGDYLHLPLRIILILFSASFPLFYLIVMLLLGRLRQYVPAILLALYLTLFASDVFFSPVSEAHTGIACMFLFLGLFFRYQPEERMPLWVHPLLILCLWLALYSHFVVVVAFGFLLAYALLHQGRQFLGTRARRLRIIAYLLAGLILFALKLREGQQSNYDSNKLDPVLKANMLDVFASFHNGGAKTMLQLLLSNYWISMLVFCCSVFILIRLGKWLLLSFTVLSALCFFALVCLTYPNSYGRELQFYMENEWMVLGIIAATPFVIHLIPRLRPNVALLALSVVFGVRVIYTCLSFPLFDARYHIEDVMVEKLHRQGIAKAFIVAEKPESNRLLVMDWGAPWESLLLSNLKGYPTQVTFQVVEPSFAVPQPNEHSFVTPFYQIDAWHLNPGYFHVHDPAPYQVLTLKDAQHSVK
jgi:hypothetical protein